MNDPGSTRTARLQRRRPDKSYSGTIEEVFSHRSEIPLGATVELNVFEKKAAGEGSLQRQMINPDPKLAKPLVGRGLLAGVLSSIDFMSRKHEEAELEDHPIR